MNRIPRPVIATALFLFGLVAYGILSELAGPNPHAIRSLAWDFLATGASAVLVLGVAIGCFRAGDAILESDGEAHEWSVLDVPKAESVLREAA